MFVLFFIITFVWSLGISTSTLSTYFLGARIDLSAEDNTITLALAECPSRPYAELIKSDVPGPSSPRSSRSAALRPSPPSTMKVPPIGPSAAKPTRRELLAQLEMVSRKPRSGKRKTSYYIEKDITDLVKKCKICQEHAKISRLPSEPLTSITSPWPFQQWGLDILGPLPLGKG